MATTWVFERGGQRLRMQRQDVLGELRLVVWGDALTERLQIFDDELQLVAWMTAFDTHLVTEGWSLVDFFPERRSAIIDHGLPGRRRPEAPTRYTDASDDAAADARFRPLRP